MSGTGAVPKPIPIEPFAVNKDMGRILLRRGGETIGAGRPPSVTSLAQTLKFDRNCFGNSSMKLATQESEPYARQYVHDLRASARSGQILNSLQV